MKLNNIFTKAVALMVGLMVFASCSDFLDINDDPNNATSATPDQLLPAIQLSMGTHFGGRAAAGGSINETPAIMVQHYYTLGNSRFSFDGSSLNSFFRDVYADAIRDIEVLIAATAPDQQDLPIHSGVAKLCKAYIYSVLVDNFGDVPFSEAGLGSANLDPRFDDEADIYNALFTLIDEGIAEVNSASTVTPVNDFFYPTGNVVAYKDNWTRMGNSLKLKLFNQIRLVDPTTAAAGINGILNAPAANPIIDANAQDWDFRYGTADNPEERHPLFQNNYIAGTAQYMSNYLLNTMINSGDPRLPYYVYRQTLADPTGTDVPCDAIPCFYGYQGSGYIGRDMGDPSGIPNDQGIRATFGVYPVGGRFDTGANNDAVDQTVASGAGIAPIITNFIMLFTQAEAALTLGTTGDPRALFEAGMRAQMDKVVNFAAATSSEAPSAASVAADIDTYVAAVLADYDAATSDEERLGVVMTEKHLATFGNGMEAYNDYRRTGFPRFIDQNLQDGSFADYPSNAVSLSPLGPFPRSFPYANRELQTNANAPAQRLVATPIFWDNN